MLFSDILRLSLRMFKARTLRTFLTMLGMGVGISAIVFLVSLGYGLQDTILQKITTSDALSTLDVSAGTGADTPSLDDATVKTLGNVPNVEIVIPVNELRGQMKVSGITLDSGALIASPTYFRLEGIKVDGSVIDGSAPEAVITSGVAKAFGKDPKELLGESIGLSIFVTRDSGALNGFLQQKEHGRQSEPLHQRQVPE